VIRLLNTGMPHHTPFNEEISTVLQQTNGIGATLSLWAQSSDSDAVRVRSGHYITSTLFLPCSLPDNAHDQYLVPA
jgi:hypothetical protein